MKLFPALACKNGLKQIFAVLALSLVGVVSAHAADAGTTVRSAVDAWLKGRFKVEEVRKTPLPGMWEVRIGSNLIYVDESGKFAFIEGNMVELANNRNLTRERTEEILAINFKDLPLNLAIKQVHGNGKRVFAIFEDANCGYCKKMRREMADLKDVTIYTFAVAFLSPDSETKAQKALCAPDKAKAWNDMLISGKVPDNPGTCDSALPKIRELAEKYGVSATPTVFFSNGRRLQGYVPVAQFEKMLVEYSKL